MDNEPRPLRPGAGRDAGPRDPEVRPDPAGGPDLPSLIGAARRAVLDVWKAVDLDGPDAFRQAAPADADVLPTFFNAGSSLVLALDDMAASLSEGDPGPPAASGGRSPGQGFSCPSGDGERALRWVVEILSQAGVEVDETDVLNWTAGQRQRAVDWVNKRTLGVGPGAATRPDFLPESQGDD